MQEHEMKIRRLLTFKELKALGLSFSREHLWRLEAAGKFPRRIYLSSQKMPWFADEIADWLQARGNERSTRVYRNHE
jgi:prophage regulatory protein